MHNILFVSIIIKCANNNRECLCYSAVTAGKVYLLKQVFVFVDTTAIQHTAVLVDSSVIGFDGSYSLTIPMDAKYFIKAYPDPIAFPDFIPTYFIPAPPFGIALWNQAPIHFSDTDAYSAMDITVIQGQTWTQGPGYCSGTISFGTGKTTYVVGDPVPGIDVELEQVPGGIVKHTITDPTGMYSFDNIPIGYTYKVVVDVPGVTVTNTLQISVSSTDTVFTNLNYDMDTTGGSVVITEVRMLNTKPKSIHVYPNPNSGNFTVIASAAKQSEITIYNILGEVVYSKQLITINEQLSTNLPGGIYFLKIETEEAVKTQKIIIE